MNIKHVKNVFYLTENGKEKWDVFILDICVEYETCAMVTRGKQCKAALHVQPERLNSVGSKEYAIVRPLDES